MVLLNQLLRQEGYTTLMPNGLYIVQYVDSYGRFGHSQKLVVLH
jgi:hypothetical protein